MAEQKQISEREYVIPLRREWTKVPRYKRTSKSVKAVKEFIAKHMKVPDRDLDKVKLDIYLNNEMWYRGARKPYSKIKVKAKKVGENIFVELVDVPEVVRFTKEKHNRWHKKSDKKVKGAASEDKGEEKTDEEQKKETEKEKSVEELNQKIAQQKAKEQKHTVGKGKDPQIQRKALKK